MSNCKHRIGPFCHLGYFDGRPSSQDCFGCDSYSGRSRGMGDRLAKFFKLLRIERVFLLWSKKSGKPCGCKKRQARLNRAMPTKGSK